MTYLLDSCILADLSTSTPDPALVNWLNAQPEESIYISVVTISEIAESIENEVSLDTQKRLNEWLSNDLLVRFSGRISEINAAVCIKWAELITVFKNLGRVISLADSLSLAIALVYDHTLVTKDVAVFEDTGAKILCPYDNK